MGRIVWRGRRSTFPEQQQLTSPRRCRRSRCGTEESGAVTRLVACEKPRCTALRAGQHSVSAICRTTQAHQERSTPRHEQTCVRDRMQYIINYHEASSIVCDPSCADLCPSAETRAQEVLVFGSREPGSSTSTASSAAQSWCGAGVGTMTAIDGSCPTALDAFVWCCVEVCGSAGRFSSPIAVAPLVTGRAADAAAAACA